MFQDYLYLSVIIYCNSFTNYKFDSMRVNQIASSTAHGKCVQDLCHWVIALGTNLLLEAFIYLPDLSPS